MAITLAQSPVNNASGSTTQLNVTLGSTATNGNGIVVVIGSTTAGPSSVTDDAGNTYTQRRTANFFGSPFCNIYDCVNISGSPTVIHVNFAVARACQACVYEVLGTLTAHAGNAASANTTAAAAGAFSTTTADTIAFAGLKDNTITSQPSGYTSDMNTNGAAAAHIVYTSTQSSINPTWANSSGGTGCCIEAYTSTNTGGTVYNKSVTSTLTLTQTVDEIHPLLVRTVTSTLVPSQTIGLDIAISNQSVNSTLTLTETQTVNTVLNLDVSDTLTLVSSNSLIPVQPIVGTITFTQTLGSVISKPRSVTSTLTLTETQAELKVANKLVSSNLNLMQPNRIPLNYVLNLEVTSTLTLTGTVFEQDSKAVNQTLTFTGAAVAYIAKHITSTLTLTQSFERLLTANRTLISSFEPFQTIVSGPNMLNKSVSQTLTFAQNVVAFRVHGVSESLSFSQTIVVNVSKRVKSTLSLHQLITLNKVLNLHLTSTLHPVQIVQRSIVKQDSVTSFLGFNESQRGVKEFFETVTSNLTFASNAVREVFLRSITSTLTLTHTVTKSKVPALSVTSTLLLVETPAMVRSTIQTLTSQLLFKATHPRTFGDFGFDLPNVQALISEPYTLLRGADQIVVLPNPQLGDGEGNTGEFTVRYSINGTTYSYVKNNNTSKLNYSFWLSRRKCRELQRFLQTYQAQLVELQNWKGEIWKVYITNNPFEASSQSRYLGEANDERWDISLEFEGVRMN